MSLFTLCICYPTYNRGRIFINDIKELLSNTDARFCIKIQDNNSDDGSFEELSSINDSRLFIEQNPQNIGGISNTNRVFYNCPDAEYILFCLDKDKVDKRFLSDFIDFLKANNPHSGLINLYPSSEKRLFDIKKAGVESIENTAYLSRHPSGSFWNKKELESYIDKIDSNITSTFPFWIDVLQANFALNHDSYIVYIPVIIHAPFRKDYMAARPKTLTYSENNIYFSLKKRVEAYIYYMKDLEVRQIIQSDKERLTYKMLLRVLSLVTIGAIRAYGDEGNCWHYNVAPRKITIKECLDNIKTVNKTFIYEVSPNLSIYRKTLFVLSSNLRVLLSLLKFYIFKY